MGIIKKGVLGGFSGKVGNVVGASWKGIDYIRTKPDHVFNPNTPKQQAQRSKFKGVQEFAQLLKRPIVTPIWNPVAVKMSGFNLFVKKNIFAFNSSGEIEDYSKVQIAMGKIAFPFEFNTEMDKTDGTKIMLDWKDDKEVYQFSEEALLNVVILTKGSSRPRRYFAICKRSELKAEIDIDGRYPEGTEINVYAFFSEDEFSKFTDSEHHALTA